MEEFDWSAESQVQIPAEHIWCDLNADLEPKMNHQTPLTYGYIWVQSFHTLQNCNRGGNRKIKNKNFVSIFVATVWKCHFLFLRSWCASTFVHIMNVQVIGVWQSPQLCQLSAAPLCPPPFATTVSQSPSAATSNLSLFAGELKVSSPFTFVFSTLILYVLYSAF